MLFSRSFVPSADGDRFLGPQDIFVGATVTIHAHDFEVVGADEFTSAFMEQSADEVNFCFMYY